MWRYVLRRAYFGLIGMLLLTVPLFAGMRHVVHELPRCQLVTPGYHCLPNDAGVAIPREGFGYLIWQTGSPPWDYWPLAVMLLALAGAVDLALMLRSRLRQSAT
ncbi:MAG TPA: hypothetical protein VFY79_06310 [Dehalococcoidia bacterium]|jgi:hypothetical protein|nr:hypothetical protein [Dehalococcoidia bacterium]